MREEGQRVGAVECESVSSCELLGGIVGGAVRGLEREEREVPKYPVKRPSKGLKGLAVWDVIGWVVWGKGMDGGGRGLGWGGMGWEMWVLGFLCCG